jgi:hypothetical protein
LKKKWVLGTLHQGLDKNFSGSWGRVQFAEGVSDEGLAVEAVGGVEDFVAGFFLVGDRGVEFAGGDLFGAGVDEAELAGGEVDFSTVAGGAHGWAKSAAEEGAVFVEIAGAVDEVEYGAGLVVGELFEEDGGFMVFVKDARGAVAWEPGIEAGQGVRYALVDARCFGWVGLVEGGEAFAEARCILVGDGEHADAALGAAGFADEMLAAAAVGVGHSGIYDLDEIGIGRHGVRLLGEAELT